jgi:hypothetical protein
MGADGPALRYVLLPALIEKLAAGRARDEADIIDLIRANPDKLGSIRAHLKTVHPPYAEEFDRLTERAGEEDNN